MEVIKWSYYFPLILATISMAELIKGKMGASVKCASMGEICHILGNEELKNSNQKKCCGKVCSLQLKQSAKSFHFEPDCWGSGSSE